MGHALSIENGDLPQKLNILDFNYEKDLEEVYPVMFTPDRVAAALLAGDVCFVTVRCRREREASLTDSMYRYGYKRASVRRHPKLGVILEFSRKPYSSN